MPDTFIGTDGLTRPIWANDDGLMRDYYDTEWGVPVVSEKGVFERACLEGFQAGLSWRTILVKREAFRAVFAGFDPDVVATFNEDDVVRLSQDARIIRHPGKIRAAISNAQATLKLRERAASGEEGLQGFTLRNGLKVEPGLPALVWGFMPEHSPAPSSFAEVPTQDETSASLAKALKKNGFKFIGPTSAYALMEAIGLVDTHLVSSHRRGVSKLWDVNGAPLQAS